MVRNSRIELKNGIAYLGSSRCTFESKEIREYIEKQLEENEKGFYLDLEEYTYSIIIDDDKSIAKIRFLNQVRTTQYLSHYVVKCEKCGKTKNVYYNYTNRHYLGIRRESIREVEDYNQELENRTLLYYRNPEIYECVHCQMPTIFKAVGYVRLPYVDDDMPF